jgi:hypothetical protein
MDKVRLNLETGEVERLEDVLKREVTLRDELIDHILDRAAAIARTSDFYRSKTVPITSATTNTDAEDMFEVAKHACRTIGHDLEEDDGDDEQMYCLRCNNTFPK